MHNQDHPTHSADVQGYEESDMNFSLIIAAAIGLSILMFGGVIAAMVVLRTIETRPAMNTTAPSPLAVDETWLVEGPTLQMDVRKDRDVEFAGEMARLNSYGKVSDVAGMQRAHVPVEVAMDLLLEKKVPYRQEPVVAAVVPQDGDFWGNDEGDTQDAPEN